VNTENLSVCVTVNCKVYELTIALQLSVVLSGAYKASINPVIQSKLRLIIMTAANDNINFSIYQV
jgi:hypothetical protein